MGSDERNIVGGTDLIDVGDISPDFEESLSGTEIDDRAGGSAMPGLTPEAEAAGPAIASLKDRLAALVIDVAFLYGLYWVTLVLFRAIALGSAAGPIPASGTMGLIFHGIFLGIAFLWFFLPEFVLGASVGKLCTHLSVRGTDGGSPGLIGCLVRNVLRPIDLLLAPLVISAAAMEWTGWHQRLGDLAGRTVVIRKLSHPTRQYALTLAMIASASRRAIAFGIDLVIGGAFIVGYALLLNPEEPLLSMFLVVLFPLLLIAIVTAIEVATGTTPGKWLLGIAICHEEGTPLDVASGLMRTLWRPISDTPIGFVAALVSLRRQTPGDLAAGTVGARAPREWSGAVGLLVALLLAGSALFGGMQNRDSFLHSGFEINFLPAIDWSGRGAAAQAAKPQYLTIQDFFFAAGDPETKRRPSIFEPGERLFLIFNVDGYTQQEGAVWLQEDLAVRYPDDSLGLKLENINDFKQTVENPGPIRFENNIALPASAQPGRYTVTITLRDVHSRRELKEQRFFYITPPKGEADAKGASTEGKASQPIENTTETPLAPEERSPVPGSSLSNIPYAPDEGEE